MKTGLAFRHETDPLHGFRLAGYQSCRDSCMTHFGLLLPFPAIGVTENKVNIVMKRFPHIAPQSLPNVLLCGLIQVSQEITEYVDNCFVRRKGWYIFDVESLLGSKMRWSEM